MPSSCNAAAGWVLADPFRAKHVSLRWCWGWSPMLEDSRRLGRMEAAGGLTVVAAAAAQGAEKRTEPSAVCLCAARALTVLDRIMFSMGGADTSRRR